MASLSSLLETIRSEFRDVDSSLTRWAGIEEQREGTGVLAVLCSLAAVWITWKFLLMCRDTLKLRRMSRTVPSIRYVLGSRDRLTVVDLVYWSIVFGGCGWSKDQLVGGGSCSRVQHPDAESTKNNSVRPRSDSANECCTSTVRYAAADSSRQPTAVLLYHTRSKPNHDPTPRLVNRQKAVGVQAPSYIIPAAHMGSVSHIPEMHVNNRPSAPAGIFSPTPNSRATHALHSQSAEPSQPETIGMI